MTQAFSLKLGNSTRKIILLKLADHANDDGYCWPSYQHLADICECDKRTVKRHMKFLKEEGLLSVQHRMTSKGNSSNLYQLTLENYKNKITRTHTQINHNTLSPDQIQIDSRGDNLSPHSDRGSPSGDRVSPHGDPVPPRITNETSMNHQRDIYANLDFSKWPERPPNEFLDEHVSHRKQKRSVKLSQPVLDRLGKEVTKAIAMGYPLDKVLEKWLSKSWIGFEAEWLTNENGIVTKNNDDGSERAKRLMADSRKRFNM